MVSNYRLPLMLQNPECQRLLATSYSTILAKVINNFLSIKHAFVFFFFRTSSIGLFVVSDSANHCFLSNQFSPTHSYGMSTLSAPVFEALGTWRGANEEEFLPLKEQHAGTNN